MPDQVKLVEREAFVVAAKDGATDGLALRKAFAAEMKAFDLKARTIDFIISTAIVDRTKDSIAVNGWEYDDYLRSPVVLWCHDSSQPPVGKAISVSKGKDALLSTAEFMSRDLSPFADSVFRMYQEKFLSAVSVGFIPKTYTFSSEKGREFGMDFKTQELLEYSCCPVPANPEALVAARAAGIDTEPLRAWAEKLLDGGGHIMVPRGLLEETFRQAKTPRAVRQKYLAKAEAAAADWRAGAAEDLSVVESDAWDGAAAAKRMLDAAGFDGDAPDAAKAARGFLIHDAANSTLRSSYALPFADMVGGELKAIKAGIAAAKSRVDQTDAPAAVRAEAKEIADEYDLKEVVAVEKIISAPAEKSGRRISSANEAKLKEAMGHHESATKCIKDVLASNAAADDPDGDNDDPADVPEVIVLSAIERRIAEAKALRDSISK